MRRPRPCAGLLLLCAVALSACTGAREPLPVVLVVVDTLRADRLPVYGAVRPTSPALSRFAERAAVFERAFASSPWTAPSMGSMLTGVLPSRHGFGERLDEELVSFGALQENVPTLAEVLGGRGYATAALINNPFLQPGSGIERGFETYEYAETTNIHVRRAGRVAEAALRWIDGRGDDRRWFLLVHVMDPHMAYDPPPGARGRFTRGLETRLSLPFDDLKGVRNRTLELSPEDRVFVRGAYDEEILGLDAGLERLLGGLAARGVLDDGLVILTSDHGEEHWDHGRFEHGHSVHQEVLRVPLLVWGRGVEARRIEVPVSHVDVAPTVLDAVGGTPPAGSAGVSLWPLVTGGEAPAERALFAEHVLYGPERQVIVRWPWKLERIPRRDATRLYQLERDPEERENLAEAHPEEVARLRGALDDALARAREGRAAAARAELDDATRSQLESLGYLE